MPATWLVHPGKAPGALGRAARVLIGCIFKLGRRRLCSHTKPISYNPCALGAAEAVEQQNPFLLLPSLVCDTKYLKTAPTLPHNRTANGHSCSYRDLLCCWRTFSNNFTRKLLNFSSLGPLCNHSCDCPKDRLGNDCERPSTPARMAPFVQPEHREAAAPLTCVNSCNGRGRCELGECICERGALGWKHVVIGSAPASGMRGAGAGVRVRLVVVLGCACANVVRFGDEVTVRRLTHPACAGLRPPSTAPGFWGADCSLSLDESNRPVILAGRGYVPRERGPKIYIYDLPHKYSSW